MPSTRRGASTTEHASSTPDPASVHSRTLAHETVPTPSDEILSLRRDWRFAAVCQFIFTFDEAIQVKEFETEEFEDDLTLGTLKILPQLMNRLLHVLTFDRRITLETWEHYLRLQFERRNPEVSPLGTEEEPVAWCSLAPEQRLVIIHTVTEWHMANPGKIRKMMKDEENNFLWRIEPVGRDAQHNTYWLFDDNRLWIQRVPPKPKKSSQKKKAARDHRPPTKKQKVSSSRTASKPPAPVGFEERSADGRYPKRSLAITKPKQPATGVLGATRSTRASRLRGAVPVEDDGWQKIPEELLKENDVSIDIPDGAAKASGIVNGKGSEDGHRAGEQVFSKTLGKRPFTEDESDGESDLTELSESAEEADKQATEEDIKMEDVAIDHYARDSRSHPLGAAITPDPSSEAMVPPDFVEWETVCVTLYEWENIADRFSRSNNREEKSFHRLLLDEICPRVLKELRAIERLKKTSVALENRKRSARLATRELEKEAQRLEAQQRAEEEAQNQRAKRHEQRMARQEAEREEREKKRREREERAARGRQRDMWQREQSGTQTPNAKSEGEEGESKDPPAAPADADVQPKAKPVNRAVPTDEPWELDCEICKAKGWNIDDGSKITCCETCSKWQHTACHDKADAEAGRPKRRWSAVTFKCKACKNKRRRDRYAERAQEERQARESQPIQPQSQNGATSDSAPVASEDGLKIHVTLPKRTPSAHSSPILNGVLQSRPSSFPAVHHASIYPSHAVQPAHTDYPLHSYEPSTHPSQHRSSERNASQSQPVQPPVTHSHHVRSPQQHEGQSPVYHPRSYPVSSYPTPSGYGVQHGYPVSSHPSGQPSNVPAQYPHPYPPYSSNANGYTYGHGRTQASPGWTSQDYAAFYAHTAGNRQYPYTTPHDTQHGASSSSGYGTTSGKHPAWVSAAHTQRSPHHSGTMPLASSYGSSAVPDHRTGSPLIPGGPYGAFPAPPPPSAYPAEAQARQ